MIWSDDDGVTWSKPSGPFTNLVKNDWSWIGLGPPASLQLKSNNRIIVPCYHSIAHIDGDFSKGHIIYSDDYGNSWSLSKGIFGLGPNNDYDTFFPSESQAIELENGSILINSRGASSYRIGTISNDFGDTFQNSFLWKDLLDETTGCEGSMIKHPMSGNIYYSGLTPDEFTELRFNLTIHKSTDNAKTWQFIDIIDYWTSAYSALIPLEKQSNNNQDTIGILYENALEIRLVFIPDHISFETLTFESDL